MSEDVHQALAALEDADVATRLAAQDVLLGQADAVVSTVCARLHETTSIRLRRELVWFLAHALVDGSEVRAALAHARSDVDATIRSLAEEAEARLDDPGRAEADHRAWLEGHLDASE